MIRGDIVVCVRKQKNLIVGKGYKIRHSNFSTYCEFYPVKIYVGNEIGYLEYYNVKTDGLFNFIPLKEIRKLKLKKIEREN